MKRFVSKNMLAALTLAVSCSACAQTEHSFEVSKNIDIFNSLYRELDMLYVDTLDAKKVIEYGIDAMLSNLDPYTEYYSKEDMGDLKIMTTGKYGGIGSIIRLRKDSSIIIGEPYEGMPAAVAGLKVGDVIKQIDDKEVTKGMLTSDVSNMLRGEPGTTFVLKVLRPGEKKLRAFTITRKNIKLPAIPYTAVIQGVGYITLSQFTEGCAKDVRKSVINLKEKGAKAIVLDLRNNGGGLLAEAVDIVNLFVPKGLKIVETKGKVKSANSVYKTKSEPLDLDIPLAVLVNGNTASAAEIVSGSLQDLDRATIIGVKTFGKGLVQTPRDLPYDSSIKLTTSKYYIPSGRCIQAIDYKRKREGGKDVADDSLKHIFYTSKGRVVKDGGGIMPDIVMKHDTLPNLLFYLGNDDVLVDWGTKYANAHASISSVAEFEITEEDFNDFKKMIKNSGFKYDRMSEKRLEDLKKVAQFEGYYDDAKAEFAALEAKLQHNIDRDLEIHKKDIKKMMAQEIVKRYFYQAGMIEEALKDDDDLKKAIEVIKN